MRMLACCLLVITLAACEPPQKPVPPPSVWLKVVPKKPTAADMERLLHDRKLDEIQSQVRALRELTNPTVGGATR